MIQILYLGRLKEQLATHREELEWAGGTTDDLLQRLRTRGERWQAVLATENIFRIAVNHQIAQENVIIPDGAEVAILPPVTGG